MEHLGNLKKELNKTFAIKGIQLVTISRSTAYGEYVPYHFVETESQFKKLVLEM